MVRRLVMWFAVVLIAGPVAAAPAPSYFPLAPGATWARKSSDGAQVNARVVGTKTVGLVRCTVVATASVRGGTERTTHICYQATDQEIRIIESEAPGGRSIVLDPPRSLMKLPPQAGKSWAWIPKSAPVDMKVTDEWVREETVRVPAGTFRAWKLMTVTKRGEDTATVRTWYAPGVGVVKIEREEIRDGQKREGGSELVSYKIP